MKFLVDAQLPRQSTIWIRAAGHDAIHTLDLPDGNRTTDGSIVALCMSEDRVVVTKDRDFVSSFVVHREPQRLLLISTGNIGNPELRKLFAAHLSTIVDAFARWSYVELTGWGVVVHD